MATRQYVGARYIPIFADPVEWDNTREYEYLTMVQHVGETYMSKQDVPIGAPLPDVGQGEESTEYWVHMSNWNAQVETYRQEVLLYNGRISTLEDNLPIADFDSVNTVSNAISNLQTQIGNGFDATDNIAAVIGSGFDATDTIAAAITGEAQTREEQDDIRAITFETVADMKASTDLKAGMICKTNGYYATGDKGAAWYSISNSGTANEMDVIACGALYANLVLQNDYIYPEQIGAYGDGTNDDADVIQYALSICNNVILSNTYCIEKKITLDNKQTINGNGTLLCGSNFADTCMVLIGDTSCPKPHNVTDMDSNLTFNINLDCNFNVFTDGVHVSSSFRNMYRIKITHCSNIGVKTGVQPSNTNAYWLDSAENTYFIFGNNGNDNSTILSTAGNSLLLYADASDDYFAYVSCNNFMRCVYLDGYDRFGTIHPWNSATNLFTGSIALDTISGKAEFETLYCDGLETAIKIADNTNHLIGNVVINYAPQNDNNKTVYPINHTGNNYVTGDLNFYDLNFGEVHFDDSMYGNGFIKCKVNGPRITWSSTKTDIGLLFQTDCVQIGSATAGPGINDSSKMYSGYSGQWLIAKKRTTINNFAELEVMSTDGTKDEKIVYSFTASAPSTNIVTANWHSLF